MAFTGATPESLLARSDSKNPATTCKGMTRLGRPCRNPLDLDAIRNSRNNGVLAVVSVVSDSDDEEDEEIGAAAFFCWRHKDQAEQLVAANAAAPQRQDTQLFPLQNRSSIDTLVARLGVLEVQEPTGQPEKKRRERRPGDGNAPTNRPPRRVNRPPTWDKVQGPLMSVPSDLMKQRPSQSRPPKKKKQGFWEMMCCGSADDDYVEVVRHRKRIDQRRPDVSQHVPAAPAQQPPRVHQGYSTPPSISNPPTTMPGRKPLAQQPAATIPPRKSSETSNLLSYIPKNLNPQTTSLLLTELSKPISPHDEEGYIYIFWLTEESLGPAPSSTASSLLAPPTRPEQTRRTSDVLRQYSVRRPRRPTPRSSPNRPPRKSAVAEDSSGADTTEDKKTILLKVGRANNVHRRMNEWTRQCGYSLSLVRFYPYVPSTPQPSPSPSPSPRASPPNSRRPSSQNQSQSVNPNSNQGQRPTDTARRTSSSGAGVRKVPHAHRVERLIHIELGGQRVVKRCEACGKEHREWFEVEASRDGVRGVDGVVRRWVEWAERAGGPA